MKKNSGKVPYKPFYPSFYKGSRWLFYELPAPFDIPDAPGCYVVYADKKIIYIGQSSNVKKRIQNYYSFTKDVDLKWLNFLTNGFAVFLFYFLFYILLRKFTNYELPFVNSYVSWTIMVLYIFGIGFYGFKKKTGIFSDYHKKIIAL